MTERRYDDFRITLSARPDGTFDARAVGADGAAISGEFRLPVAADELERVVVRIAHEAPRGAASGGDAGAAEPAGVRPVAGPTLDAEQLGGALNDALLAGAIGAGYEAARLRAGERGRGLRLTLSLAGAPALLGVPWELLYRRPRFLANQRRTPLVRHLEVGSFPPPPPIEGAVRVLGIVASPTDCGPLDVAAERARVEAAVAAVVADGRVELDWLEPATPRRLREALRDGTYHVIHYVGHSDFTADGDGVLFLESAEGTRADVDGTELANLLADQEQLRLVVLNSCEGARTSLTDPFAGVATTLVQLGVPAVVAMQFEISDGAAILFAEELYTNLIARQAPIDAAVSEARKAIYIEQAGVEWATPVLFMGDTDVDLFDFRVAAAVLPPPRRPEAEENGPPPTLPPPAPPATAPAAPARRRVRLPLAAAVVGVLVAAVVVAIVVLAGRDDDDDQATAGSTPSSAAAVIDPTAAPAVPGGEPSSPTTPPAGTAVPADGRMLGELAAPSEVRTYAFDAGNGEIVHIGSAEPCGDGTVQVIGPSGASEAIVGLCQDAGRLEIAATGSYRVELAGIGAYDLTADPGPARRRHATARRREGGGRDHRRRLAPRVDVRRRAGRSRRGARDRAVRRPRLPARRAVGRVPRHPVAVLRVARAGGRRARHLHARRRQQRRHGRLRPHRGQGLTAAAMRPRSAFTISQAPSLQFEITVQRTPVAGSSVEAAEMPASWPTICASSPVGHSQTPSP